MSPEVQEAIEEACDSQVAISGYEFGARRKPIPVGRAKDLIYRFAQNLPSEMTMSELCDELCIGNSQGSREE